MKHISILIVLGFLSMNKIEAQPGTLDPSFHSDGKVITDVGTDKSAIYGLAIQPDGKIVAAGFRETQFSHNFSLVRYMGDGTLDASFDLDGIVTTTFTSDSRAQSVALQSDGKIVATGFTSGGYDFAIVRYNSDGSQDPSFDGDGKVTTDLGYNERANKIVIQPDGKILVGGTYFSKYFMLARYNPNGSLDTSFSGNGILSTYSGNGYDELTSLLLQPDGKIIAGGWNQGGPTSFFMVRYHSNGDLDSSFSGDGKNLFSLTPQGLQKLTSMALQQDGKIIVTGGYSSDYINYYYAITRLNTNGSFDNTFDNDGMILTNISGGYDFSSTAIQMDGKILIAGSSTNTATDFDFTLMRYNSNGTPDQSFDSDGITTTAMSNLRDEAYTMAIQPDGKILLGGYSNTEVSNNYSFALARYFSGIEVGILDFSLNPKLVLFYPNPVHQYAVIHYELGHSEVISMDLKDIEGCHISTFVDHEPREPGRYSQKLEIPDNIRPGSYILTISDGSGRKIYVKILKD